MAKVVNGATRGRPGTFIVDYRDATGRRRWATFKTKRAAYDALAEKIREARQPLRPRTDPRMSLADYAAAFWLPRIQAKPRTVATYAAALRLHIAPALGTVPVRDVTRPLLRHLFAELATRKAPKTVQLILAVVRTLLSSAVEDGLIVANPAAGLGRALKLGARAVGIETIKAMTADQVAALLDALHTAPTFYERRLYPLFVTLARTGLRIGEVFGLRGDDVDLPGRRLYIRRQLSRGMVGTPKSGKERVVSVSWDLVAALRQHEKDIKTEALRRGWGGVPELVFVNSEGKPLEENRVRRVMRKALQRAGLPLHFSPHSLRHSFASILLARGESAQFVQEQLGHQSLDLTVRTYGRWLPKQPLMGGVDGLDSKGNGSSVVATRPLVGLVGAQVGGIPRGSEGGLVVGLLTNPSAASASPRRSAGSRRRSSARIRGRGRPTWPCSTRSAGRPPAG